MSTSVDCYLCAERVLVRRGELADDKLREHMENECSFRLPTGPPSLDDGGGSGTFGRQNSRYALRSAPTQMQMHIDGEAMHLGDGTAAELAAADSSALPPLPGVGSHHSEDSNIRMTRAKSKELTSGQLNMARIRSLDGQSQSHTPHLSRGNSNSNVLGAHGLLQSATTIGMPLRRKPSLERGPSTTATNPSANAMHAATSVPSVSAPPHNAHTSNASRSRNNATDIDYDDRNGNAVHPFSRMSNLAGGPNSSSQDVHANSLSSASLSAPPSAASALSDGAPSYDRQRTPDRGRGSRVTRQKSHHNVHSDSAAAANTNGTHRSQLSNSHSSSPHPHATAHTQQHAHAHVHGNTNATAVANSSLLDAPSASGNINSGNDTNHSQTLAKSHSQQRRQREKDREREREREDDVKLHAAASDDVSSVPLVRMPSRKRSRRSYMQDAQNAANSLVSTSASNSMPATEELFPKSFLSQASATIPSSTALSESSTASSASGSALSSASLDWLLSTLSRDSEKEHERIRKSLHQVFDWSPTQPHNAEEKAQDEFMKRLVSAYRQAYSQFHQHLQTHGPSSRHRTRFIRAAAVYLVDRQITKLANANVISPPASPVNSALAEPASDGAALLSVPSTAGSASSRSSSPAPAGVLPGPRSTRPKYPQSARELPDKLSSIHHPVVTPLAALLHTLADVFLFNALDVVAWCIYIDRLEGKILQKQHTIQHIIRALAFAAYTIKLVFTDDSPFMSSTSHSLSMSASDLSHAASTSALHSGDDSAAGGGSSSSALSSHLSAFTAVALARGGGVMLLPVMAVLFDSDFNVSYSRWIHEKQELPLMPHPHTHLNAAGVPLVSLKSDSNLPPLLPQINPQEPIRLGMCPSLISRMFQLFDECLSDSPANALNINTNNTNANANSNATGINTQ